MQKSVEEKVFAYCSRYQMFQKGDTVVLGVSGGADSVCLLFVLLSLQKKWDLKLHVVHVNHGIRQDAGEDAEYVRQLCATHGIPYLLVEENIPLLAKQWGVSEEEAGRKVRYEAFAGVLSQEKQGKIAVAHNSNDRAETMLFHLFRGTGLTGLGGIRPVREQIVRPILCLEREEIEAYLQEKQIAYRHDSTNDSDDYTRNKIRHHILTYAKEEIVSGCVGNMSRTADILAETENYIEEQTETAIRNCVQMTTAETTETGSKAREIHVNHTLFMQQHPVIQKRVILSILKELSPGHKDIATVHVEDVLSLFTENGNRRFSLPYGIAAGRLYDEVVICRGNLSEERGFEEICITQEKLSESEWSISLNGHGTLYFRRIECKKAGINCKDIPQNQYTKWFDYDKIKECLTLRTRLTGDVLYINSPQGMKRKKLKDYMIDEKILPQKRDALPLLAEGENVIWLIGYRISEYYKVTSDTENILQVCYVPKEENIWQSV